MAVIFTDISGNLFNKEASSTSGHTFQYMSEKFVKSQMSEPIELPSGW